MYEHAWFGGHRLGGSSELHRGIALDIHEHTTTFFAARCCGLLSEQRKSHEQDSDNEESCESESESERTLLHLCVTFDSEVGTLRPILSAASLINSASFSLSIARA
jgi:hypothetical protein